MHDVRFALRTFLKTPGPILLAIFAIALGIGANTAIFSVVRAVLLKPPPYAAPDRLVALFEADTAAGTPRVDTALANYEEWRDRTQSFENVAASAYWIPALTGESETEQLLAGHVTANFFTTLGVHPAMGRDFTTVSMSALTSVMGPKRKRAMPIMWLPRSATTPGPPAGSSRQV